MFFQANESRKIQYHHQETEYADFKIEPLLPHKYSENGPGVAVGDINGDGLEDFFVGGAYNHSGKFFIQQKDGVFLHKALTKERKYEEDMGALLFDADNDKDDDLYIVSGGNEFESGSRYYQHRLYFNDGKGNFKLNNGALPEITSSGSCVIAADLENDRDLDLFVGGRITPHGYPHAGQSYVLENNRGMFTDATDKIAPGLKSIGMVTAGLWTDVNNDNQVDLMIVGEWMPITLFLNREGKLYHKPNSIPNSSGWWNSITGSDFDSDGDIDYVLGNLGLNSRYKTSKKEPVGLYVADVNKDGVLDPILAHYIQGVNRPAHPRDDILVQITSFKKKYPSYASYADATLEQFFGDAKPSVLQSEIFASAYLQNKGNDHWELEPLPVDAQFAPVFGISTGEFTGDEFEDAVLVGNFYAPEVLTGRYDAFTGLLLKGDGAGNFKALSRQESGISVTGDAKGLALLKTNDNKTLLLATQNNDRLLAYERNSNPSPIIDTRPTDWYAIITNSKGTKSKRELYYGSGYLSQSSRSLILPTDVKSVEVFDFAGKSREIILK